MGARAKKISVSDRWRWPTLLAALGCVIVAIGPAACQSDALPGADGGRDTSASGMGGQAAGGTAGMAGSPGVGGLATGGTAGAVGSGGTIDGGAGGGTGGAAAGAGGAIDGGSGGGTGGAAIGTGGQGCDLITTLAFSAPSETSVGANMTVHGLAVADVTGDGIADVILSEQPSGAPPFVGAIRLYAGSGDGRLGAPTTAWSGDPLGGIVAVDVDGDHHVDLVAADDERHIEGTRWLTLVLLGHDNGTFTAGSSYLDPTSGLGDPVSGDFNHDGLPDVAFSKEGEIDVRLNNGASFPQERAFPFEHLLGQNRAVAVGRFNDDADLDVAYTVSGEQFLSEDGTIGVLYGDGTGSLVPGPTVDANTFAGNIAAADFDGDGLDDLAAITLAPNPDTFSLKVFSLSGTSDLALRKTYETQLPFASEACQIAAADFDGDGRQDLALISSDLLIFRGRGDGTFFDPVAYRGASTSNRAQRISISDLNHDGRPDIVVTSYFTLVVILNQTSTHCGGSDGSIDGGAGGAGGGTGDAAAGTGGAVGGGTGGHGCDLTARGGAGGSDPSPNTLAFSATQTAIDPIMTVHGFAVADVTGDGILDVLLSEQPSSAPPFFGEIHLYAGSGDGSLGVPTTAWSGDPIGGVAAVDVDADHHVDLVVGYHHLNDPVTPWSNLVLRGDDSGTFTTGLSYTEPNSVEDPLIADFNSDGVPDLVFSTFGQLNVRMNSGGTFPQESSFLFDPDTFSYLGGRLVFGKFNHDAYLDVAYGMSGNPIANPNGGLHGAIGVLYGDGTGSLVAGPAIDAGNFAGNIAAADFDGDGLVDVAALTDVTTPDPTTFSLKVFLLSGTSDMALCKTYDVQLPTRATQIAAADFYGDGRQDLAIIGSGVSIFRGRGDGTFFDPVDLQISFDPVVFSTGWSTEDPPTFISISDLNHDGRPDIVTASQFHLAVILNQSSSPDGGP